MRALLLLVGIAACGPRVVDEPMPVPSPVAPRSPERIPHDFEPRGYALALAFGETRFTGTVTIDGDITQASSVIWLHASGLQIVSARAIQGARSVALVAAPVRLLELVAFLARTPLSPGRWSIEVVYTGELPTSDDVLKRYATNKDVNGLFQQRVDGVRYIFTQFEPMYARRAFPCIDEPDRKVPWQLTLDVRRTELALSNTPIVRETIRGDRKRVEFAPTAPLPSYLVAFAVGPFDLVDAGKTKSGVPIRIATQRGRTADAAFAVKWTPRLFDLVEDFVGVPYAYRKLDFVAVPTTGTFWGAMENPGLVTFNHALMKGGWIQVTLHEIAHQWFGDYVTPRSWEDIWLNEAWATWVTDKLVARLGAEALEPPLESEPARATDFALTPPKSVRVPADLARTNESLMSYFHGQLAQPILVWLEHYLGEAKLLEVVRGYLQKHAHGVVATSDLVAALGNPALGTALEARLDGPLFLVPSLEAELRCEATAKIVLTLPHPDVWHSMPACVVYEQRGARVETCIDVAPTATIALQTCPAWAVASERTPEVALRLSPVKVDVAWPLLTDGERIREMLLARGEAALRIAARMLDREATQQVAAVELVRLADLVPDALRRQFDAKVLTAIGARARDAVAKPQAMLANAAIIELAAIAGDVEVQRAAIALVPNADVHPSLAFARRIAERFGRPPRDPKAMDSDSRELWLARGCSQAAIDEIQRTGYREVAIATERIKDCMQRKAALAPAFQTWLVPSRVRSSR